MCGPVCDCNNRSAPILCQQPVSTHPASPLLLLRWAVAEVAAVAAVGVVGMGAAVAEVTAGLHGGGVAGVVRAGLIGVGARLVPCHYPYLHPHLHPHLLEPRVLLVWPRVLVKGIVEALVLVALAVVVLWRVVAVLVEVCALVVLTLVVWAT